MATLWGWISILSDVLEKNPDLWGCLLINLIIFSNIIYRYILRRKGIQTEAIIVENIKERSDGSDIWYSIFKFNTSEHEEVEAVGRTERSKAGELGDKVTIYYDPKNPKNIDYHRKPWDKFFIFLMVLLTLILPFYMALTGR